MKTCIDCQQDKALSEFNKNHSYADGYTWTCTICTNIRNKISRDKNKEKIKARRDQFRLNNPEIVKKWKKDNYERNKEKIKIKQKEYAIKNREHLLQQKRNYYQKNKDVFKIKQKIYVQKNKTKVRERQYKYYYDRRDKYNLKAINRKKEDPVFASKCYFRSMAANAFKRKGYRKAIKTEQMLGCSLEVAKQHIERQFKKGMTWKNHGHIGSVWHIDHKIPLVTAKTIEDVIRLCHYTNLQPMWAKDNLEKADKITPTQMTLTI